MKPSAVDKLIEALHESHTDEEIKVLIKKHVVDYSMWDYMYTEDWRETCEENYDDWIKEGTE